MTGRPAEPGRLDRPLWAGDIVTAIAVFALVFGAAFIADSRGPPRGPSTLLLAVGVTLVIGGAAWMALRIGLAIHWRRTELREDPLAELFPQVIPFESSGVHIQVTGWICRAEAEAGARVQLRLVVLGQNNHEGERVLRMRLRSPMETVHKTVGTVACELTLGPGALGAWVRTLDLAFSTGRIDFRLAPRVEVTVRGRRRRMRRGLGVGPSAEGSALAALTGNVAALYAGSGSPHACIFAPAPPPGPWLVDGEHAIWRLEEGWVGSRGDWQALPRPVHEHR